jgi:hypothetical protein
VMRVWNRTKKRNTYENIFYERKNNVWKLKMY